MTFPIDGKRYMNIMKCNTHGPLKGILHRYALWHE